MSWWCCLRTGPWTTCWAVSTAPGWQDFRGRHSQGAEQPDPRMGRARRRPQGGALRRRCRHGLPDPDSGEEWYHVNTPAGTIDDCDPTRLSPRLVRDYLRRPGSQRLSSLLGFDELGYRLDQGEVGERLGEVPEMLTGRCVDFFGVQVQRAGVGQELLA